jgi:hypothetical protein
VEGEKKTYSMIKGSNPDMVLERKNGCNVVIKTLFSGSVTLVEHLVQTPEIKGLNPVMALEKKMAIKKVI